MKNQKINISELQTKNKSDFDIKIAESGKSTLNKLNEVQLNFTE